MYGNARHCAAGLMPIFYIDIKGEVVQFTKIISGRCEIDYHTSNAKFRHFVGAVKLLA